MSASATVRIEKITKEAIDLLARERKAILGGAYETLDSITAKKVAFLEELDRLASGIASAPPSIRADERREQLKSLLGIIARRSEENQRLIAAARDGVASARARLEAIAKPRTEIGAYGRHGQQIRSAAAADGSLKY